MEYKNRFSKYKKTLTGRLVLKPLQIFSIECAAQCFFSHIALGSGLQVTTWGRTQVQADVLQQPSEGLKSNGFLQWMWAVGHKNKDFWFDGLCAHPPANPGETAPECWQHGNIGRPTKLGFDIIVPNVAVGGLRGCYPSNGKNSSAL